MQNLLELAKAEFYQELKSEGLKDIVIKKLWGQIYDQGKLHFSDMQYIDKQKLEQLSLTHTIKRPQIVQDLLSVDGTRKWLLRLDDGSLIETVFIPEEDRGSLCVSSQVGCTLTCKFCHTGTQKFVRNLSVSEIVAQIMIARDACNEWPSTKLPRKISNIVMMGMGEPFYNYENVRTALKICMDNEGISISKRKITISTSGVIPRIYECADELKTNLAVSLHACDDATRSKIMPINNKYKIAELLAACKYYASANQNRKITFEYVMLEGVNDSSTDAENLVSLLKNIPAKINIIPFNPWPGSFFKCSDAATIQNFTNILHKAGLICITRKTRGQDILAACGQLKSATERQKQSVLH